MKIAGIIFIVAVAIIFSVVGFLIVNGSVLDSKNNRQFNYLLPTSLTDEHVVKKCRTDDPTDCSYYFEALIGYENDWGEGLTFFPSLVTEDGEKIQTYPEIKIKIKKRDGKIFVIFKLARTRNEEIAFFRSGILRVRPLG